MSDTENRDQEELAIAKFIQMVKDECEWQDVHNADKFIEIMTDVEENIKDGKRCT